MAVCRRVVSDRVLGRFRRQILAGDDADANNPVVPVVRNDNVLELSLMDESPDHRGGPRTVSSHALTVFLLCTQTGFCCPPGWWMWSRSSSPSSARSSSRGALRSLGDVPMSVMELFGS